MFKRYFAFAAALAAGVLFANLPARAIVVDDVHTWVFNGSDGTNTLSMGGTLTSSPFENFIGGHDILSITGNVSFNGGPAQAIIALVPNPTQPLATSFYDNVVYYNPQPAGQNLDGFGMLFTYGAGFNMHVWGTHDYGGIVVASADPAMTFDPLYPNIFIGDFLLDPSPTPIPAALPLFATGLGVIGFAAHRRKRKARSQ